MDIHINTELCSFQIAEFNDFIVKPQDRRFLMIYVRNNHDSEAYLVCLPDLI